MMGVECESVCSGWPTTPPSVVVTGFAQQPL